LSQALGEFIELVVHVFSFVFLAGINDFQPVGLLQVGLRG
jgi:hypothetical protein